jgi:hypothetical protein
MPSVYRACAMSRLACQGSDYPDASTKHLEDAKVLDRNGRYDGSAYHAGYVVECALKAVLLYETSWNRRTGQYDRKKLDQVQIRLSELSHGLEGLFEELTRVYATATTQSSPYLPALSASAAIMGWRPGHRYRPTGHRKRAEAQAMLNDAQQVYDRTIGQMMRDMVI